MRKSIVLKKIILILLIIYAFITFINQQKLLNSYSMQKSNLEEQIAEAQEKQELLKKEKENVNSLEYIEAVARERLDMYKENEVVYIDSEN